ncbi:MAG TPA: DUF192 domain-containing protein [Erythrobacter sp.]|nr:DUF192 domain-containing protein [Erythrobacter sp.]
MRSQWLVALVAFAPCAVLACSPAPVADTQSGAAGEPAGAAQSARHPVSGLQVIDLAIQSAKTRHRFRVELADTSEAQRQGLMFRTELGEDEGMLFPSDVPDVRSFWMKNTPLSLDIIFVGADGRILNIAANTVPYSLESVRSEGLASAVLELRGGRAAELGIAPGDLVEYTLP